VCVGYNLYKRQVSTMRKSRREESKDILEKDEIEWMYKSTREVS